ncbi:hypothetical protein AVEN_245643-1 [Araneus ventricosus]|uniref:EGF-like domain-containing protein n=1 Tax=Araneus ventricosus TaxID=182803 RepID=A0A4Y2P0Z5_ARAVE|nr:hypothetical protein AVEN_245643-1 [Araneus ventricosus]
MWWVGKLIVLLLFLSAFLHTYGASVLRTKDLYEKNSLLSLIDGQIAEECDCGENGLCSIENDVKTCICNKNFVEIDGKCEECDCGEDGKCFFLNGKKTCECHELYKEDNGLCKKCDCGAYGLCEFAGSSKKCTCAPKTNELDGKCIECDCGSSTSYCYYNYYGNKACDCSWGEIDVNGQCKECNCGFQGLCRLEFGRKKCLCAPNFIESDGKCVPSLANTTSTSVNTEPSSLMTTILTSTVTSCDCGVGGSCHLDSSGEKICNCFSGYAPNEGYCDECDCGSHGKCSLETGLKRCICDVKYAEKNGKCECK